jgi:tetratricopeptide (TPR) repeat protein
MSAATSRLDKLQRLLQLDPNDAFVLYGIAQEHAKGGADGQERAVEYYDRCIAADPNYCYAYYHKAVTLQGLSRRDEARASAAAGLDVAKAANDLKAVSELSSLLNVL